MAWCWCIGNLVPDTPSDCFANGWLKDVKSGANTIASYSYDEVGNRTRTDNGNDTYALFAYGANDPRYPLTSITWVFRESCSRNERVCLRRQERVTMWAIRSR